MQATRGKSKLRSSIWQYYDKLENRRFRCRLCIQTMSGNTYRHLQIHHPITYEKLQEAQKQAEEIDAAEHMAKQQLERDKKNRDRKNSSLWSFFDDLGNQSVRCQLCKITLCGNMARHLQTKHIKAYEEYKKQMKMKEITTDEEIIKEAASDPKQSMNELLRKLGTKIDTYLYKCNFCEKEIKLSKTTFWNLRKHIATKHPSRYDELMKHFKGNSSVNTKRVRREEHDTPKPRPGWIKKYCERIQEGLYRCTLCTREIRMAEGLTNNMKRHVRSLHPRAYQEEVKLNEDGEDEVHGEVVEYIVEYLETDNLESTKTTDNDIAHEGSQDEDSDKTVCFEDTDSFQNLKTSLEATVSSDDEPLLAKKERNLVEEVIVELISVKDPDLENKIKHLCQKPTQGKHVTRDCTWNFFRSIGHTNLYACLFCNRDIKIQRGCGNMKRHLIARHKKQYEIIKKYDPNNVSAIEEDQEQQKQNDMPSLEPEAEIEATPQQNLLLTENTFTCSLCDAEIPYDGNKDTVIKHILEYHPGGEIIQDIEECAVAASDEAL